MNAAMPENYKSITVIISTFNRAECLRETLDSLTKVDTSDLDVEYVIIDNNSNDNTSTIIERYARQLPIKHLFEKRPGKNRALNLAINTVNLKNIIVFSDDDVTPQPDWLQQVASQTEKWPRHKVFGGKIHIKWPTINQEPPRWCTAIWLQSICFVLHDYKSDQQPYPANEYPFGPNFWVKKEVFANGVRYNEQLGPMPKKRLMGSETSFLIELSRNGLQPVYIPEAFVFHRVQAAEVNRKAVMKRVLRAGRTQPHLKRANNPDGFESNIVSHLINLIHGVMALLKSILPGDEALRFSSRCGGLSRIASATESILIIYHSKTPRHK